MLDADAYKEAITGLPAGAVYAVSSADGTETFDFSGYVDGRLVYTIASLYGGARPDGSLDPHTQETYLGLAALQLRVAGSYPIVWACQDSTDAVALQRMFMAHEQGLKSLYPNTRITLQVIPPPQGT